MNNKSRTIESHHNKSPDSILKKASLKKISSQKQLKKDNSLKHIPHKPYIAKNNSFSKNSPKFGSSKSQKSLVEGFAPIKKTTTEKKQLLFVQRPKIMKKKNQSSGQLHDKLKSLQDKLQQLKINIKKSDEMIKTSLNKSKTKTKSKSKPKSKSKKISTPKSISKKHIPFNILTHQQEKHDSSNKANALNSYVTRVMPNKKPKDVKESTLKSPKSESIGYPYYVGNMVKHINKQQDHPVKEHLLQSITTMNYLKKLTTPTHEAIQHIKIKVNTSLKSDDVKTLVLDLDQTLIHCNDTDEVSDFKVPITFPNGETIQAGVNVRPYAKQFLKNVSKHFEVVVFTASHPCYANVVIDCLDPERKLISQRVFRDNCYQTQEGMFIKDLRIFSNRDMKKLVLVDNAAHSYYFQLSNGIPIVPYYFDKKDTQLRSLQKFLLQEILPANDVRPVLQKLFKLQKYIQFNDVNKLISDLYASK